MESVEENFKSETRTIKFLFRSLFFLIHLGIVTEFVTTPKIGIVLRFIFFIWFTIPYIKTIKRRYYTYWTFSVLLLTYLIFKVYDQYYLLHNDYVSAFYIAAIVLLCFKMFLLYSPIYYPRVSWWEYDFRYRDDLKILVKNQSLNLEQNLDQEYQARLTDLRRQAGCVAMFEEFKLGDELLINATSENEALVLRAIIMSKRKDVIGRPIIYGVQFKFDNRRNKKRYQRLEKMWKREKNNKKKMKFADVL